MNPEIRERFDIFVRKKGLRQTSQRQKILEVIFAQKEPFTTEVLWQILKKKYRAVSLPTIYRTLNLLIEAGLIDSVELGENEVTYIACPSFDHSQNLLLCMDCGRTVGFEAQKLATANAKTAEQLGYQIKRQVVRLEANCEALRTQKHCQYLIERRLKSTRLPKNLSR